MCKLFDALITPILEYGLSAVGLSGREQLRN